MTKKIYLQDCDLSVRVLYPLKAHNIHTLSELSSLTKVELLRLPNIGRKALREINGLLSLYDAQLNKVKTKGMYKK